MTAPLTALVLAGQRAGERDAVAQAAGVSCKAFAPIAGLPMIEHVLQALETTGRFGRIVVSLPDGLPIDREAPGLAHRLTAGTVHRIATERSPAASVASALRDLPEGPVLVTTADHALLTPGMIHALLDGAAAEQGDIGVGMVRLAVLAIRYPALKRTRLRFSDGGVKGCNLFLLNDRAAAQRLVGFWRRMEALRKKPVRMALALGPVTLLRYVTGRLPLAAAFHQIGHRVDARLQPIMIDDADAAIDVDTSADLAFVRALREGR